nr:palindromic element RPE1 domain-containing protein [Rickettsia australis]
MLIKKFDRDTALRTAAYKSIREDSSLGSTYQLPLAASYVRRLVK